MIGRSSIETLPRILRLLKKREASTTKIATEIHADRRTVNTVLNVAIGVGFVEYKALKLEKQEYRLYSLTPEFRNFLEEEEVRPRRNKEVKSR